VTGAQRALAFLRDTYERRAGRLVPVPCGVVAVTDDLPLAYDLNHVIVDGWDGDAARLAACCDEAQAAVGFGHRRSVVLEPGLVARLADDLAELDLTFAGRYLVMTRSRAPERGSDATAVELAPEQHARGRAAALTGGHDPEIARQLLELDRRVEASVPTRHFGVLDGDLPVAWTSLYHDGEVAQVEGVETLETYRGRGYASAVVLRAAEAAEAAGATTTFLVTSERDWPQHLYRRLGFDAVATELTFGGPR
jgi:ribosomal protein S18 acetylase RimI-like enzyme